MGRNFAILCLLWFCRSIHLTTYPLAVLADSRWIAESALRFGDSARMSALSLSNAAIWLQNRIAGQLKTYSLNIHWFPFVGRWLAHLQQVQCTDELNVDCLPSFHCWLYPLGASDCVGGDTATDANLQAPTWWWLGQATPADPMDITAWSIRRVGFVQKTDLRNFGWPRVLVPVSVQCRAERIVIVTRQ